MNSPNRPKRIPSNIVPSRNTQRGRGSFSGRGRGSFSGRGRGSFSGRGRGRWQPPETVIKNLFGRERKQVRFKDREESEKNKEDLIRQINDEIQNLPIYLDVIEEKNSNLLLKLWNEPIKTRRITANTKI